MHSFVNVLLTDFDVDDVEIESNFSFSPKQLFIMLYKQLLSKTKKQRFQIEKVSKIKLIFLPDFSRY
jgi:hypothetical protein